MKSQTDMTAAVVAYTKIRKDYDPVGGIFDEDSPRVAAVKRLVADLDAADRAIITLYTDIGSVRKVAALLGVSRSALHNEIKRIRQTILQRYDNLH